MVKGCKEVPPEVKKEMIDSLESKKIAKSYSSSNNFDPFDNDILGDDANNEDQIQDEVVFLGSGSGNSGSGANATKRKCTMTEYFSQVNRNQKKANMRQTTIDETLDPGKVQYATQCIARFFYQAGIAFNAARLESFKKMIGAVGECPGMKPPSYHDLRVPLLLKEVNNTEKLLEAHKKEWEVTGCTLMCDGWTDRRNRTLINFLVNSPRGTVFFDTIDASSYSKTRVRLFELVSNWIERIGPKNVLQVVTDNASNFRAAGKHLEAHYPHLSWSPCAAHCMDLMLEDFGNMHSVKNTIKKSIKLSGYIYNHTLALEMMRGYTKERELIRPAKTRRLAELCGYLEQRRKKKATFVERIVLSPHYWNGVVYALKVSTPLVKVLRLADSEKKPSMGYMYEAIGKAKDVIKRSFNGHEAKYSDVYTTINKRWECQLKRPLHAAGYFFNPEFFYSCPNIEEDEDIIGGLFSCIEKLVPSPHEQNLIMNIQLPLYKRAEGLFGSKFAIMNRKAVSPAEWWRTYGQSTPELRRLAIRILSLTTSACGCERNWSVFEQIHIKKRNRLERKKLRDLVYVKYNQTLVDRYNVKDVIDPISL